MSKPPPEEKRARGKDAGRWKVRNAGSKIRRWRVDRAPATQMDTSRSTKKRICLKSAAGKTPRAACTTDITRKEDQGQQRRKKKKNGRERKSDNGK